MIFLLSWWLVKNELSISHLARSWIGFGRKKTQTKRVFQNQANPENFQFQFCNFIHLLLKMALRQLWKFIQMYKYILEKVIFTRYQMQCSIIWIQLQLQVGKWLSKIPLDKAFWSFCVGSSIPVPMTRRLMEKHVQARISQFVLHCNFSNSFWIPSSPLFLIPHLPLELVYKP